MSWLFLLAYTCSGLAGLIYEVSWTRLLTLHIGHTTGAASAVVAAFLGGLAVGAAVGGTAASRRSPRACLRIYIALELGVAVAALALPFALRAMTPLLSWAYGDGDPGLLFPAIRLLICFALVFVPAAALGASFPIAIRWYAHRSANPARATGWLYALNTTGAAAGALLAGFILIPAIGVSGTTMIGMAASVAAALAVALVVRLDRASPPPPPPPPSLPQMGGTEVKAPLRAPALILGLSGFAALMHEIVWTRILALALGPTIYAFSATLAAVVGGVAIGSAAGAWIGGWTRHPSRWLALALIAGAAAVSYTSVVAGHDLALMVAVQAASPDLAAHWLRRGLLLTFALVVPTAFCSGAAFPLALAAMRPSAGRRPGHAAVADDDRDHARSFGFVYAINTIGAVTGSLAAGFLFIPAIGLQATLAVVSACLIAAALVAILREPLAAGTRGFAIAAAAAVAIALTVMPPWDRALLASGGYLYAPYVPDGLDLESQLRAGTLLYYREGAAATVTVKRLTGTTTLAVDGKTDASNRGDMLTQKLIAHLPLLLHDQPREVAIVGLGSGVTLGAALTHPIARADVIELSPEVVEASAHFAAENRQALADPRTHLIVGDGRSHLQLTPRRYDVIISEPSNPWIAGVAALFTREFFVAARDRLAPGGIIGQWANGYNISERDLRAIVATFRSVFADATVWRVGDDDVLMIGSNGDGPAIESRLGAIAAHWHRPGVAADLAERAVLEPFSLLSLFAGGPAEIERYAPGAEVLHDDRMTLEFSAPRAMHRREAEPDGPGLASLLAEGEGPPAMREALAAGGAAQWRNRGLMMSRRDAHAAAFADFSRALRIDAGDGAALDGLVRTAIVSQRAAEAMTVIHGIAANRPPAMEMQIALSKLMEAGGSREDAIDGARTAAALAPSRAEPLEQLASLFADSGDTVRLDDTVAALTAIAPGRAATHFHAAVAAFLHERPEDALALARKAIVADPGFAPVYDLIGAAYTRLDRPAEARAAFLKSLDFDAHDSSAYANLGLLDLASGDRAAAANHFAEALWLVPDSSVAREGLARAR